MLIKVFSCMKTILPCVLPLDTKLSKLDMLLLASSYISHHWPRLQEDCYEDYMHPVKLVRGVVEE